MTWIVVVQGEYLQMFSLNHIKRYKLDLSQTDNISQSEKRYELSIPPAFSMRINFIDRWQARAIHISITISLFFFLRHVLIFFV